MKFIKLSSIHENEIIAIEVKNFNHIVMEQQSEKTVIDMGKLRSFSVKETIDEIIAKLENNESDDWIENTGVQPCADDRMVFVMFADGSVLKGTADHWEWEKGGEYSVSKYKFDQELNK